MKKPKLIVFDLNQTLIKENSWLNLNLALGVSKDEDDMLMRWGEEGIISDAEGQALLCALYRKRGSPNRSTITEVLNRYTFLPQAESTIKTLIEQGFTLALVSGSMDILVREVAAKLNIERWACNNVFVFDQNDNLERIETICNEADFKLRQLHKLCDFLKINIDDSMCVGDGSGDKLMFEASGNGVTFEGSAIANSAAKIIQSLKDIIELVA